MADVIDLKPTDPCPACGGRFAAARGLTLEAFRKIFDKENPQPVPAFTDTLHPEQLKDLGALHLCERCGYRTRFPVERGAGSGRPSSASAAA